MKEFKLMPMVEYVLSNQPEGLEVQSINAQQSDRTRRYYQNISYANFLKMTLELWMFVPCGENNVPLEEPDKENFIFEEHPELPDNPKEYDEEKFNEYLKQFQQAQSRVLFEWFDYEEDIDLGEPIITNGDFFTSVSALNTCKVEDLIQHETYLTPAALKMIGR
jgi:hypothetical protein